MLNQSSRRALPQVIQFMSIERQEFRQGFLLPAIGHVALILSDDQREPRDLGGEVTQFDPPKLVSGMSVRRSASPRRLLISASIARISL